MITGMALWGYGTMDLETGIFTAAVSGTTYDTKAGQYPDAGRLLCGDRRGLVRRRSRCVCVGRKPGRHRRAWRTYNAFIKVVRPAGRSHDAAASPTSPASRRLTTTPSKCKTTGYEAPAVYSILGIEVAPMHYYGDAAQYDYDKQQVRLPLRRSVDRAGEDHHADGRRPV